MRFEIVTIFPGFFSSIFENGILRRALAEGLVEVGIHDLRNFTHDRHRTVDDRPFGGGEGMVLKPEPLAEALAALGIEPKPKLEPSSTSGAKARLDFTALTAPLRPCPFKATSLSAACEADEDSGQRLARLKSCPNTGFGEEIDGEQPTEALAQEKRRACVVLLSAQGRPFTQGIARELAALDRVVLICGRYEGVDERINTLYCDMELSIGDYVLSGGELAAAVVIDATMRLIPGVLGNEASGEFESFGVADGEIEIAKDGVPRSQHGSGGLLDYPHYTRPAEFAGLRAPDVLLNGDHLQIRRWRREQQLRKTLANRPDLLANAALSQEDRRLLESIAHEDC
jgi:tRNA (guanine37-N1)-methyltransferase